MKNDPIVEEIRTFRAAHSAKYDNDLDRIFLAIKESEKQHMYKLVNREAKHLPQKEKNYNGLEKDAAKKRGASQP